MTTGFLPSAQFHVQPDGVWLEIETPSGRRAAINLREVSAASEVGEAFQEWCDWHIGPVVSRES
jgi:hypothetical protein